jgi:hypothetical protein
MGKSKKVPGGTVTSIGPYSATSYIGNYHDQSGRGSSSGIVATNMDSSGQTEVENLETSMKIPHSDGGMKDYIFSSYNKIGGASFADRHRQILRGGGSKNAKLRKSTLLAKLQENMAGLPGNEVQLRNGGWGNPARYGGGGSTNPYTGGSSSGGSNTPPPPPTSHDGNTDWELQGTGHGQFGNIPAGYNTKPGKSQAHLYPDDHPRAFSPVGNTTPKWGQKAGNWILNQGTNIMGGISPWGTGWGSVLKGEGNPLGGVNLNNPGAIEHSSKIGSSIHGIPGLNIEAGKFGKTLNRAQTFGPHDFLLPKGELRDASRGVNQMFEPLFRSAFMPGLGAGGLGNKSGFNIPWKKMKFWRDGGFPNSRDRYEGPGGPNRVLVGDDGLYYYLDENNQYQQLDQNQIDLGQFSPSGEGQGGTGETTIGGTGLSSTPSGQWWSRPESQKAPQSKDGTVNNTNPPLVRDNTKVSPIPAQQLKLMPNSEEPQLNQATPLPEGWTYPTSETNKDSAKAKRWGKGVDWAGVGTDALQFLPALMAWRDEPDYMKKARHMEDPIDLTGNREVRLDRVSYNQERAANSADYHALVKSIEGTGGGPATMVNKMAAYGKKQAADMNIASQESRKNIAINNAEEQQNAQIRQANSQIALHNIRNDMAADEFNIKNEMYVNEFNTAADAATKDRKLNAVSTAVQQLGMLRARKLQKEGMTDLAEAISGETGIDERRKLKKALKGSSFGDKEFNTYKPNERNQIVSTIYEDYNGDVDAYNADVAAGKIPPYGQNSESNEGVWDSEQGKYIPVTKEDKEIADKASKDAENKVKNKEQEAEDAEKETVVTDHDARYDYKIGADGKHYYRLKNGEWVLATGKGLEAIKKVFK